MCLCTRQKVNQTDYYCTACKANFHISCLKKKSTSLPTRRTFVCQDCTENKTNNIKPEVEGKETLKENIPNSNGSLKKEMEFSDPLKPKSIASPVKQNPEELVTQAVIEEMEKSVADVNLDNQVSVELEPVSKIQVLDVAKEKQPTKDSNYQVIEIPDMDEPDISEQLQVVSECKKVMQTPTSTKKAYEVIDLDSEEDLNKVPSIEQNSVNESSQTTAQSQAQDTDHTQTTEITSTESPTDSLKRKAQLDQESFLLQMDLDITKLGQTPVKPSLEKRRKVLESISKPITINLQKKEKNSWYDKNDNCEVIDLTEKQLADLKLKQLSKFKLVELEQNVIEVEPEDLEESEDSEDEWERRMQQYAENEQLLKNLEGDVTKTIMDNIPTDAKLERDLKAIKSELIKSNGGNGTPRGLSVTLMEHQVHGLAWMMYMEQDDKKRGGILADDMGLGKTIQTLALLHQNRVYPCSDRGGTLIVAPLALIHQWKREIKDKSRTNLNVKVHHGSDRIKDHRDLRKFDIVITTYSVLQLDAPEEAQELADGTIVPEKRPGVLYKARFQRVVLDEAHIIKNRKSRISKAVYLLDAEYRFSLSGTPLQNCVDDIYSQFRFLKVPIWSNHKEFTQSISKHIYRDDMQKSKAAIQKLQAVLRGYLLRRTKDAKDTYGDPIIKLVDRNVEIEKIQLNPAERQFYDIISKKANAEFDNIMGAAHGMFNYTSILVLLLRLRQAASHPHLIKEVFEEARVGNYNLTFMQFSSGILNQMENRNGLLDFVSGEESPELSAAKRKLSRAAFDSVISSARSGELIYQSCPLCSDVVSDGKVSYCGHTFCAECIESYLQTNAFGEEEDFTKPCPVCRHSMEQNELISVNVFLPSRQTRTDTPLPVGDAEMQLKSVLEQFHPDGGFHDWITSSKVDKMIEILQKIREESRIARARGEDPIKTVV